MPELPEVETTVLSLKEKVLNETFVFVWAETENKKIKKVERKKIEDIKRFGKGIFFFLNDNTSLFIHLRMTGHLLLGKWDYKKNLFTGGKEWKSNDRIMQEKKNGFLRYVFFLESGRQLALSDPRKFAKVSLLSREEMEKYIEKLGPDPLLIKKRDFINLFEGRKKEIKPLLMDQCFLSGIGNIYAAEILFKAKVDPRKKTHLLRNDELEKIYFFMKSILKKAIKLKGDSTSDYRLLNGKKGEYQNHHFVYDRKGVSCFICGEIIKREVIGGRGTYYCPKCQK